MMWRYRSFEERLAQAERLKSGLARLGPDFRARLCFSCDGEGECRQTYTAGCGGGHFGAMGHCDWCDGTGLRMGDAAAPESVFHQIMNAGEAGSPPASARPARSLRAGQE